MSNSVRMTLCSGQVVLTRTYNARIKGLQQFLVTYDESRGIVLTLAREIAQRDYPNCAGERSATRLLVRTHLSQCPASLAMGRAA